MPASAGSRVKVTDTHGPFMVGDLTVLRVGGTVALHFGTPSGRFVFHVRERSFVKHARGARDDHGHPFRTLEQIDAEVAKADEIRPRTIRNEGAWNRAELAYADLLNNPALTIANAARRHDISENTLSAWIANHRREEWAAFRESRFSAKRKATGGGVRLSQDRESLYLTIIAEMNAKKYPTLAKAAAAHGVPYMTVYGWMRSHPEKVAQVDGNAPLLKSNGKIL